MTDRLSVRDAPDSLSHEQEPRDELAGREGAGCIALRGFGQLLVLVSGLTVVILAVTWMAPLFARSPDESWQRLAEALGVEARRTVPAWWYTVVTAVIAMVAWWCQVVVGATRAIRAGRRRLLRWAWLLLAALLVLIGLDHVVGLHQVIRGQVPFLPGTLGSRPSEAVVTLLALVIVLLLVAAAAFRDVVLLSTAGLVFVSGQVVVGSRFLSLPLSDHHAAVTEVALEWLGLLIVGAAAWARMRRCAAVPDPP